jgi:predicted nuclease with TOPRIM domain
MDVRSGREIVELHKEFEFKMKELEEAATRIEDLGYTKSLLHAQIIKLGEELKVLETTRFQALDPVTVHKSALGGHDYFVS